jgi:hypothetical protein
MKNYSSKDKLNSEEIAWYPGWKEPLVQKISEEIVDTTFKLRRIGYDEFTITFGADGRIKRGAGRYEVYWDVEIDSIHQYLDIFVENLRNCRLRKEIDGVWRGVSEIYQGVHFELVPFKNNIIKGSTATRKKRKIIGAKKPIHTMLVGQLGNCLRSIASTKILADFLGLQWDIDLSMSLSPKYVMDIVKQLFPDKTVEYQPDSYVQFGENKYLNFKGPPGTNTHPILEAEILGLPTFEFGIRQIYAFKISGMDLKYYIGKKLAFYKEINWPSDLLKAIAEYSSLVNLPNIIGVHIRFTDNLTDKRKCELNLNTPLESFITKLSSLKQQKILICSDNEDVKRHLTDLLQDIEILTAPKINWNGIDLQALFEMQLLGRTKYIIGSYSSTFSYEAAFLYGIDLELFVNNKWTTYKVNNL